MRDGMTGGRAARMRALLAIRGSTSQVSEVGCCGMPAWSVDGQSDRRFELGKLYVEPVTHVGQHADLSADHLVTETVRLYFSHAEMLQWHVTDNVAED